MGCSAQPLVSVIIPTLNAGDGLSRLLKSVRSQIVPGDIEVLVVDSGSSDGTPGLARKNQARVLSVPLTQFGHGRTRNEAIQASKGSFVALTVQDALPTDDLWLARLLTPLLQQPDVAGSYGLQIAPFSAGLLARTRSLSWCQHNSSAKVKSLETPNAFWEMSPTERLELIRFDNVSSCIRRTAWQATPYPDCDYGEDMAWAKETLLEGHKIAYVPTARVWHCHERGWLYELRRAYVDGYARVKLVRWPASSLTLGGVLKALRRMSFFLLTEEFDSMVEPSAIRSFLSAEIRHYESPEPSEPVAIYLAVLRLSWSLMETALTLCPDEVLPTGSWSDLLRFASVAVVGEHLGTAAAANLMQGFSLERALWFCLDYLLSEGI